MTPGLRAVLAIAVCCIIIPVGPAASGAPDDAADKRLLQALATAEQRGGKNSPYLLPLLEQLAQSQSRAGALTQAAASRRRALAIALRNFGSDSPSAAEAMTALALAEIDRRRYLDAEPLLIVATNVLGERVAADHPPLANALAARARVAVARGEPSTGTKWAEQAVAIAAKNPHQRSTEPLRALAAVYAADARFAEAERLLRDALARDREHSGQEGIATARSLSQLANVYVRQHRFADALPLLQEATAIDQQRLGRAHPFIADDLYELALVFEALGRAGEARKTLNAAAKLLERGDGKESARLGYVERELSRLLRAEGSIKAADAASQDAKRILKKADDEDHERERQI
jgi:predicted metal-dependent hydrolase